MKRRDVLVGIAVALAIAVLLSPWASLAPDGLEWAAERLGFIERAAEAPSVAAPLPDYTVPGVEHGGVRAAISGIIGVLLVAVVLVGLALVIRRRRTAGSGDT